MEVDIEQPQWLRSFHERSVTDELNRIAQALLDEEQDRLAFKIRTIPVRRREERWQATAALPSPFVLGPPRFKVALKIIGVGQICVGLRVVRLQAEGFMEQRHGLCQPALVREQDAQVVVGPRVSPLESQGLPVAGFCLGQFPLLHQCHAQVIVRLCNFRRKAKGDLVQGHGFCQLAAAGTAPHPDRYKHQHSPV